METEAEAEVAVEAGFSIFEAEGQGLQGFVRREMSSDSGCSAMSGFSSDNED